LAISVPAAAEGVMKKVTATIRSDFSIELNGKAVALKNEPLAYNGNSYLPVREISSLLGADVDFENGVIKLDTVITETNGESDDLAVLPINTTPERYLKQLNTEKEVLQSQYDLLKSAYDQSLEDAAFTENDRKSAENTLKSYSDQIALVEKKISAIQNKYPELTK
jgi:hypothetical protein